MLRHKADSVEPTGRISSPEAGSGSGGVRIGKAPPDNADGAFMDCETNSPDQLVPLSHRAKASKL